jgi:hypothetical protein
MSAGYWGDVMVLGIFTSFSKGFVILILSILSCTLGTSGLMGFLDTI